MNALKRGLVKVFGKSPEYATGCVKFALRLF